MIDLQAHDDVYVLRMAAGENRFNLPFVEALDAALDTLESDASKVALVTIGEGKFYSNGLDLEWMSGPGREQAAACVDRVEQLLLRMLTLPVITVAALNGHAFAAGAMIALAHDYRVMRSDRGFFCLPEVDIRIPFTELMNNLIKARLSKKTAHEAMITGKRYTAEDALRADIAHETAAEADVLPRAIALARAAASSSTSKGKDRATLSAIKKLAYRGVIEARGKGGSVFGR